MRRFLLIIFIFCSIGLIITSLDMIQVCAQEEKEIPDEIVIENTGYKTDRKGPVVFSHGDHSDSFECQQCHHIYKDGKNIWNEGDPVKKCVECPSPLKSEGNVKKLSIAYHKNCKGCHRKIAKEEGSTSAPYKQCSDCHQKKK